MALRAKTNFGRNAQHDLCQIKKQFPNAVQKDNEMRIIRELNSQIFISSILTHSGSKTRSLWLSIQQKMLENIFIFPIKCLNNIIATRKNLNKWFISLSSACSFSLKTETLQHIVLVVLPIWKRVQIPGDTIMSLSTLQLIFRQWPRAHCVLIYIKFYHQAVLPLILLDLIVSTMDHSLISALTPTFSVFKFTNLSMSTL